MTSWFGSSHNNNSGAAKSAKASVAVTQEWPCSCDHCFSVISKLPPPPAPSAPAATTTASFNGKLDKDVVKEAKEAPKSKPTWQAAAKVLGQMPGVHYVRYPFLEQYAENVFKFDKHQILRIRVQDLRTQLQKMKVLIPEILDYPAAEYEGPREAPLLTNTATPSTTVAASGPVLDMDALVAKLAEALRQQKKERKRHGHSSRRRHHHHHHHDDYEEVDEREDEESPELEEEAEAEEGKEEPEPEPEPRPSRRTRAASEGRRY